MLSNFLRAVGAVYLRVCLSVCVCLSQAAICRAHLFSLNWNLFRLNVCMVIECQLLSQSSLSHCAPFQIVVENCAQNLPANALSFFSFPL